MKSFSRRFPALMFISAMLFSFAPAGIAQERPQISAQQDTLFVGADGKFEAAPDTALVQFNIAAQEETSESAFRAASKAAENMRRVLKSNGIEPKTAEIGFYSLQPVYDWRSPKRKILAYRVTTSVSLKLTDFSKIGPLLEGISSIEQAENQTVSYTLENMDAAKQRAIKDAFDRAKASAATVAQAGGRTIAQLSYASVDTFEQVRILTAPPMAMRAMAANRAEAEPAPTAEFTPQKITVTAHVNAMFAMR